MITHQTFFLFSLMPSSTSSISSLSTDLIWNLRVSDLVALAQWIWLKLTRTLVLAKTSAQVYSDTLALALSGSWFWLHELNLRQTLTRWIWDLRVPEFVALALALAVIQILALAEASTPALALLRVSTLALAPLALTFHLRLPLPPRF